MVFRVRVDGKGRITLPKEVRAALGIKEGEDLLLDIMDGRVVLEKTEDPFKVLSEILGDLTFTRGLRRSAEEEALREVESG